MSRMPQTNFAIDVSGEAVGGVGLMLHDDVERVSAEIGYRREGRLRRSAIRDNVVLDQVLYAITDLDRAASAAQRGVARA